MSMSTTPRRRLGVMGGTFDPVHVGHLAAASEVMGQLDLDEVVFVPAIPSHKPGRNITPAEHRVAMVQLATAANPKFTVSRVDIDRGVPTYTRDTLTELGAERGDDVDLFFITGADVIRDIPNWAHSDGLFDLAQFVGVSRTGFTLSLDGLPADRIHLCRLPELAMSSTEIRDRVAGNRPVWYWLPDPVITYIGKHGLYGAKWGYGGMS